MSVAVPISSVRRSSDSPTSSVRRSSDNNNIYNRFSVPPFFPGHMLETVSSVVKNHLPIFVISAGCGVAAVAAGNYSVTDKVAIARTTVATLVGSSLIVIHRTPDPKRTIRCSSMIAGFIAGALAFTIDVGTQDEMSVVSTNMGTMILNGFSITVALGVCLSGIIAGNIRYAATVAAVVAISSIVGSFTGGAASTVYNAALRSLWRNTPFVVAAIASGIVTSCYLTNNERHKIGFTFHCDAKLSAALVIAFVASVRQLAVPLLFDGGYLVVVSQILNNAIVIAMFAIILTQGVEAIDRVLVEAVLKVCRDENLLIRPRVCTASTIAVSSAVTAVIIDPEISFIIKTIALHFAVIIAFAAYRMNIFEKIEKLIEHISYRALGVGVVSSSILTIAIGIISILYSTPIYSIVTAPLTIAAFFTIGTAVGSLRDTQLSAQSVGNSSPSTSNNATAPLI